MTLLRSLTLVAVLAVICPATVAAETSTVVLSGKPQKIYVYRPAVASASTPFVVLSSGDLGWAGFVLDVAEFLKSEGVGVIGFNTRAYLASFTGNGSTLNPAQVPADYWALAAYGQRLLAASEAPYLAGVSEGAGLSVIAAAARHHQAAYRGVITLGLPDTIGLGWSTWKDWTIWISKTDTNHPHEDVTRYLPAVSPLPVAVIQSTRDEFVPLATTHALFAATGDPKQLYLINAKNHRFSDKRDEVWTTLREAMAWIEGSTARADGLPREMR